MSNRHRFIVAAIAAIAVASVLAGPASGGGGKAKDRAHYILPPGNYGGLVFTENSTDQLPLYSGLTPLRDNITNADINEHFLPGGLQADRGDARGGHGAARRPRDL